MSQAPLTNHSITVVEKAPPTSTNVLEIKDLHKAYGKFEALKGINLTVPAGTIFGLLGSNGAGKSTLIKVLVGSSRFNSGEVKVLGLNPTKDSARLRPQLGYMPQLPALYEDLAARANIEFFGAAYHLPDLKKQVDKVLTFVDLSERQHEPVFGFSGGMKQRVSLACALVHEPKVLFLDEPTAGIDPKLREAFWQHFRALASQGVTLFISTHLMDEAMLCDRLAIMRDGLVLAEDTPKNIMRQGQARIKVVRAGVTQLFTVSNYPTELPTILQSYQLDPAVSYLEIEEDTLETIVLSLINQTSPVKAKNLVDL